MKHDIFMTDALHFQFKDEQDTLKFAQILATCVQRGIVFLIGDLGAGKTTLTRYWLQSAGHQGNVKSPTYTLVEPYQMNTATGQRQIYHFDLYRLQDPYELELIGIRDYLEQNDSLLIVEWPSKGEGILPSPNLIIDIQAKDQNREVTVTGDHSLLAQIGAHHFTG